jgi:hypothetical protein
VRNTEGRWQQYHRTPAAAFIGEPSGAVQVDHLLLGAVIADARRSNSEYFWRLRTLLEASSAAKVSVSPLSTTGWVPIRRRRRGPGPSQLPRIALERQPEHLV